MSGDYYICAICEDQFLSIWPDDEAKAEFEQLFGKPFNEEYTTPVCDDCFRAGIAAAQKEPE